MKRKFLGAPAWVDYTYQIVGWVDHTLSSLVSRLTSWRYDFMDHYCRCEKCLERKRWKESFPKS
jgi:hypothetical protein